MSIVSVRDNENNPKKSKDKKQQGEGGDIGESDKMRAKWFCCAFKLGFLQLICKAYLIFKLNLEFFSYFKTKIIMRVKAYCTQA